MLDLDSQGLSEIVRHLEAAYPAEGCGIVVEQRGQVLVRTMRNAYDRYHQADPARFPRTSRTAYFFDPKEWLSLLQEIDRGGMRIACIFHSHADAGAYFSTEDSNMAAPEGEPLYPEIEYLVVSVVGGRARDARMFLWDGTGFAGRPIALPASAK